MRIGTVIAVSLLLVTGACSDPAGPDNPRVEIRTDLTSYDLGEEGVLTFTNRQGSPVWVNIGLCLTLIEERIDGEWRDVGTFGLLTDGSTGCAGGNTTVQPAQSLSRPFAVDDRFRAGGEYRFRVAVIDDLQEFQAVPKLSNTFVVRE
jgi:hypothetical protein